MSDRILDCWFGFLEIDFLEIQFTVTFLAIKLSTYCVIEKGYPEYNLSYHSDQWQT